MMIIFLRHFEVLWVVALEVDFLQKVYRSIAVLIGFPIYELADVSDNDFFDS